MIWSERGGEADVSVLIIDPAPATVPATGAAPCPATRWGDRARKIWRGSVDSDMQGAPQATGRVNRIMATGIVTWIQVGAIPARVH